MPCIDVLTELTSGQVKSGSEVHVLTVLYMASGFPPGSRPNLGTVQAYVFSTLLQFGEPASMSDFCVAFLSGNSACFPLQSISTTSHLIPLCSKYL